MNANSLEETRSLSLLQRERIERVAVFRALQLGDMLCAVPALRSLRAALPDAHIALIGLPWAQQFADRFANYIDAFHAFPGHPEFPEQEAQTEVLDGFYRAMQTKKFSLAIQLHGSGHISNSIVREFGAKICAGHAATPTPSDDAHVWFPYPSTGPEPLRLLDLTSAIGAPDTGTHLEFPLLQQDWDELQASGVATGVTPGNYVCIHPGARFRDKCWPPQRFAAIADALVDEFGLQIVLTGSAKEADLTQAVAAQMRHPAIDTASPLSIGAMAALMRGARLLICNDTGVSHIAAGLKLKSVVIFNKADIERWAPLDHALHKYLWDPDAEKGAQVLAMARGLLSEDGPITLVP